MSFLSQIFNVIKTRLFGFYHLLDFDVFNFFLNILLTILISVNSFHSINNNCQELVHVLIIFDDKINISVGQLQSDALPSEEWEFSSIVILDIQRIQVLPKHPESGRNASEQDTLDIRKVATCAWLGKPKVLLLKRFQIFFAFFEVYFFGIPDILNFGCICLKNIFGLIDRFLTHNSELICSFDLDIPFIATEVLNDGIQRLIILETWYLLFGKSIQTLLLIHILSSTILIVLQLLVCH